MKKIFLVIMLLISFISCSEEQRFEYQLNLANENMEQKNVRKAELMYKKILEEYPNNPKTNEIKEKLKTLENRLGGGYKNLKWGISQKQAEKQVKSIVGKSTPIKPSKNMDVYYMKGSNNDPKKDSDKLILYFVQNKLAVVEYSIEFNYKQFNYQNELLDALVNKLNENYIEVKNLTMKDISKEHTINIPVRCFCWEDEITKIELAYWDCNTHDKLWKDWIQRREEQNYPYIELRTIYQCKELVDNENSIAKQIEQARYEEEKRTNKNLNRIKDNL